MKLQVYSIFDSAVEVFHSPFLAANEAHARRSVSEFIGNPQTSYHKFPEDHTLFHVGSWDDHTAQLEALTAPSRICCLLDLAEHGS